MTPAQNKQFMIIHNENRALIEQIAQDYVALWKQEGCPMKEPTEKLKHAWIIIAGCIDRVNRTWQGKDQ